MQKDYLKKEKEYFSGMRKDILELIPLNKRSGRLLEIGAGNANTLVYAKKKGYAKEVYGVDIVELEGQKSPAIDKFIVQDIETEELKLDGQFDIVLMLDILEHLNSPKNVLKKIRKNIKDEGVLIVSLPNIRHFSAMKKIFFQGDFSYEKSGIFDETHLRFFCKKNHIDLLEKAGYQIKSIEAKLGRKRRLFNLLTLKKFEEFLPIHYYSISEKKNEIDKN